MTKEQCDSPTYKQMFGQLTREQKQDNDLALLALGLLVSGLILESHFEPESLSEKAIRRLLGRVFDDLFQSGCS